MVLAWLGSAFVWLVVVALGANAWYEFAPNLAAVQRQIESGLGLPVAYRTVDGSHVEEHSVPASSALSMPASSVWVYTPPGYDPSATTRYPVVYLIHGYPGTAADWFTAGRADEVLDAMIATRMIPPVVAVAPDVNGGGVRDGECLNSLKGGPQVESWLYDDLIPWVDKSLLTQADGQHRILGGMSAGGFCSLDQGLRHLDVWGGIVALEGYGDPGKSTATDMGYDTSAFEGVSPSHYISTMTFPRTIPIFIDEGELEDPRPMELVADALKNRGQDVLFQIEAGQRHDWAMARTGLPFGLAHVVPALGWK
ncbi:MAG: alpha/beta hydrolase-fold protein [Propionibacteriaceae bacterium]|nr:alpha/beta hydrolase-fold protein [Propionibacteriaceae bacterium]